MAVNQPRRSVAPESPYRENIWILPPDAGSRSEPFFLDSCGITQRDPSYRIRRMNGSKYCVVECILRGKGHLYCENVHLEPVAGDVYILPQNVPNEYYTSPADPWEKIWFNVGGPLIDAMLECYQLTGLIYCQQTGLEDEFRTGLAMVKNADSNIYSHLAGQLTRIFSRLHQLLGDRQRGYSAEGMILKNYLDHHWHTPFSLDTLSSLINKSRVQTLRIFRNDFNTTPGAYFQQRRLQAAQQYLENTHVPIKDIAAQLGFANEFHFSAWFKKQSSCSPRKFRCNKQEPVSASPTFPETV